MWQFAQPADPYFNYVTISAIILFTIEVIVGSYGKP